MENSPNQIPVTSRLPFRIVERSPKENDKERIVLCPEIPVDGRIVNFLLKWEEITKGKWVQAIIQNGQKLQFLAKPFFLGDKKTLVNVTNFESFKQVVKSLHEKDAVEIVQKRLIQTGFHNTLFLVEKKNGTLSPVMN